MHFCKCHLALFVALHVRLMNKSRSPSAPDGNWCDISRGFFLQVSQLVKTPYIITALDQLSPLEA